VPVHSPIRPPNQDILWEAGWGEWAEQPKVPAMRSIVGMAAEGGTDSAKLKTTLGGKAG